MEPVQREGSPDSSGESAGRHDDEAVAFKLPWQGDRFWKVCPLLDSTIHLKFFKPAVLPYSIKRSLVAQSAALSNSCTVSERRGHGRETSCSRRQP